MRALFGAISAVAIFALPLAAAAQSRDGEGHAGWRQAQGERVRSENRVTQSSHVWRQDGARRAGYAPAPLARSEQRFRTERRAYGPSRFEGRREYADRDDHGREHGERGRRRYSGYYPYGYGFSVGVYPGYGDYAYAAPYGYDEYPYGYDEAYGGPDDVMPYDTGDDGSYVYAAPYAHGYYDAGPNAYDGGYMESGSGTGWSPGAPPADCGGWVWRSAYRQYQWVPAACQPCPPDWSDDR